MKKLVKLLSIASIAFGLTTSALAANCLEVIEQEVESAQRVLDQMNDSIFSGLSKRMTHDDDLAEIVIKNGTALLDLLDPSRAKHRDTLDYMEALTSVDDNCVQAYDEELRNLEETVCVNFHGHTHIITEAELFKKPSERKIVHHPTPDLISVSAYLQKKAGCKESHLNVKSRYIETR